MLLGEASSHPWNPQVLEVTALRGCMDLISEVSQSEAPSISSSSRSIRKLQQSLHGRIPGGYDTDGLLGGSVVKNPPANSGDTRDVSLIPELGRSPGVESGKLLSILARKIPWTEEHGGLQSMGHKKLDVTYDTDISQVFSGNKGESCQQKLPQVFFSFMMQMSSFYFP